MNHLAIDAQTRIVALLGSPVHHSLSPAMHNAAFSALNLNWRYVVLPVSEDGLRSAIELCRDGAIAGLNITAPYKNLATTLIDVLDTTAISSGTVNTITCHDGNLTGHNTDSQGFWHSVTETSQIFDWTGRRALVIGAGGVSRAICSALAGAGLAHIHVAARNPDSANKTVNHFQPYYDTIRWSTGGLNQIPFSDEPFDLIVNATSAGNGTLPGTVEYAHYSEWFAKLVYAVVRPMTWFVDTIYRPSPTPFCDAAQRYGSHWMTGLGMLLWQGCLAFELWTAQTAPSCVMRQALTEAITIQP
ncbi:MAG: shikimate dehydrogenase [Myxococcales bacterium]|nr:shikimate dehydrogenase [Myxococcales bacterium]